jgi:autophagy-related protein 2
MLHCIDGRPQVFESVIPSERTRISLKIMNGSIRVLAPVHPGAILFHFGELDFSTDIVGDSQENSFCLHVTTASILFLDDLAVEEPRPEAANTQVILEGTAYWKVCDVVPE